MLVLAPHKQLDSMYWSVRSRLGGFRLLAPCQYIGVSVWAIHRAFALRLLALQPSPTSVMLECHYCDTGQHAMWHHVFEVYPEYHLRCQHTCS